MADAFDLSKSSIINKATAELQTKTCHTIIKILKNNPGIILGDDVGMGKTYIAFATAVSFLQKYPEKPVIIITPSWQLNKKWYTDIRDFIKVNLNKSEPLLSETDIAVIQGTEQSFVEEIRNKAKEAKVLLIPINAFANMGWKREKSFYIACWFRHRAFREETRKRVLRAIGGDETRCNPNDFTNMGIKYQDIPIEWYVDLDEIDIHKQGEDTIWRIKEELKNLRYRAMNSVLPNGSLLILDEAHKMKNSETVKRRALENCVKGRFERGMFLTATPFELGEDELRSILDIFQNGAAPDDMKKKFRKTTELMFSEMSSYIHLMQKFEEYVQNSTPADSAVLERLIHGDVVPDSECNSDITETFDTFKQLLQQKTCLEGCMRSVIIRNVKPKDLYRHEIVGILQDGTSTGIPLSEDNYLVFAMIEKAIHQILQAGNSTFIANVKQSFTSSYSAAQAASVFKQDLPALDILRKMPLNKISHPKMTSVVDEVAYSLKQGQKTLIFCARIESIKELKENITNELDKAYQRDIIQLFPGENSDKDFENYRKRFSSPQDVSWFLLQENYIYSVLKPLMQLCGSRRLELPRPEEIADDVERLYTRYNRTVKSNYLFLKRIIEKLTFQFVLAKVPDWVRYAEGTMKQTVENILDEKYIKYGLNLLLDDEEKESEEIDDVESRSISVSVIKNILSYKGLWVRYSDFLNQLPPKERDGLVTSMIRWLRRDRRFFVELRKTEQKIPKEDRYRQVEHTFRYGSKRGDIMDWDKEFSRFFKTYVLTEGLGSKDELLLGIEKNDMVDCIYGDRDQNARDKIKAGFNTPFYPQVLLATATMQEGVDLQKECKRVIHYDLDWNPASLEQRNGRIDRIGSLTAKLREKDTTVTLDIFYPYIKNTIDESIYKTVKDREKWFNLILGGTPQWDTFEVDPDVTPISSDIFKAVQIDLHVQ